MDRGAWWAAVHGVAKTQTQLSDFTFTFHLHALEKEIATHSSVLAWRIPGTGEPGGLPSAGSHRVGHYWSDLAAAAAGLKERLCLADNMLPPSGKSSFHSKNKENYYNNKSCISFLANTFTCIIACNACKIFLDVGIITHIRQRKNGD